jgi:uncharacterized protein (TIGR03118 family)
MSWLNCLRKIVRPERRRCFKPIGFRPALEQLEDRRVLDAGYLQTNLVSDIPGMAAATDPRLVNPWGLTASSTSPFWVSDNGTGLATLYTGQGQVLPTPMPTIPSNTPGVHGTPTGTVFNTDSTGFNVSETVAGKVVTDPSLFLFDTLDGTISGWTPKVDANNAIAEVTMPGSVFTGLAIGTVGSQTFLYAADNSKGTIGVFDSNFKPVTNMAGMFKDSSLPSNASPFNIQNINGLLYVEYTEGSAAAGHGAVDIFNTEGQLIKKLIRGGALDSPWGVALAPNSFGQFSNDLLVGNFGDGHINAFNPVNGHFIGQVTTTTGQPFEEDHLWSLRFGNGGSAGSPSTLFFTAGIDVEKHGLFGSLQVPPPLSKQAFLLPNLNSAPMQNITTVPPNGDVNPYGVAFVPQNIAPGGKLHPGDILVSNFNNSMNTEGTGTTIVDISPDGQQSVFFQGQAGLGLTTALAVLKSGFVIVGNVPTNPDGTAQQGSLLILNSSGGVVSTLTSSTFLNGPWDMTVNDQGNAAQVFVASVNNGTVTRINFTIPKGGTPKEQSETTIASGYATVPSTMVVVIGPTGLAFDAQRDILYVASTQDNAIFAVPNALTSKGSHGTGKLIVQNDANLHGPLGLALAPNGDLIVANGDAVNFDPNNANELAEFTPNGTFVSQFQVDPNGFGAAFGLAVSTDNGLIRFAAVDDATNTLEIWTFQQAPPPSENKHSRSRF